MGCRENTPDSTEYIIVLSYKVYKIYIAFVGTTVVGLSYKNGRGCCNKHRAYFIQNKITSGLDFINTKQGDVQHYHDLRGEYNV